VAVDRADNAETYNPWTVVNIVFHHLAGQGLHPTLGGDDPGRPAADLLRALGVEPVVGANQQVRTDAHQRLADLREAMFGDGGSGS